ncbi:MAG: hypothetical protein JRI92_06430 [Deltaproteobacteria bacterium]|nr:hypothetical protein [Deltaproteobacteria bacterium]
MPDTITFCLFPGRLRIWQQLVVINYDNRPRTRKISDFLIAETEEGKEADSPMRI